MGYNNSPISRHFTESVVNSKVNDLRSAEMLFDKIALPGASGLLAEDPTESTKNPFVLLVSQTNLKYIWVS